MPVAILHDNCQHRWLVFDDPVAIYRAESLGDVLPMLLEIESLVESKDYWAAGFLSYEAAPAFDSALVTRPDDTFPKSWFGIYERPRALDRLESARDNVIEPGHWLPSISRNDYDRAIERIKTLIAGGDTYQVNFTLRMLSELGRGFESLDYFLKLVEAQPHGYDAYLDIGDYAICSVSPEMFFQLEGNRLSSRPMKGTARRGRTLSEDARMSQWLLHSEKNRAENVMIVDMVRNDCGRIAESGSVSVPELFKIERYPTLWQMTSLVSARTERPISEIMRALFPPASITGAPKPRTMQIIADLESQPRRIYTGTIGFLAPGRIAQFNVAIRTVLIDQRRQVAEYGVGGGIVWDSVTDEEYDECLTKARVLARCRPEFSLLETMLWTQEDGYFLLDYHLNRLSESAEYFGFSISLEQIRSELEQYASELIGRRRIRMHVARNSGVVLQNESLTGGKLTPIRLRMASRSIDSSDPFLFHKTTNRQVYDSLKAEAGDYDDVILWNERGEITETTIYNIVIHRQDGTFVTPAVDSGLLAGTYRAFLLDQKKISESIVTLTDLKAAAGIAVINSVRGWQEAEIVSEKFAAGEVPEKIGY